MTKTGEIKKRMRINTAIRITSFFIASDTPA